MNSIFTRRSVREYEKRPVETEKLERILRAGMQAPSAMNRQPWEVVVITDPDKIAEVAAITPYGGPAARAPMVLVPVCNKEFAGEKNRYWEQDLSSLVQNILLQIVEEGLGGCWMGIYPDENRTQQLADAIGAPENIIPFAMISVGYPLQENKFVDRYHPERVHYGKY
ncbi:MAG: nitroreductase family protein [Oscillospiraceae bacterium]|nr:nitroreductase family protein [Oscillospiraceae bacterium]